MLKYINKYRSISKSIKMQKKMKHSPITKNSEKSGYFQQKNSLIFKTN